MPSTLFYRRKNWGSLKGTRSTTYTYGFSMKKYLLFITEQVYVIGRELNLKHENWKNRLPGCPWQAEVDSGCYSIPLGSQDSYPKSIFLERQRVLWTKSLETRILFTLLCLLLLWFSTSCLTSLVIKSKMTLYHTIITMLFIKVIKDTGPTPKEFTLSVKQYNMISRMSQTVAWHYPE